MDVDAGDAPFAEHGHVALIVLESQRAFESDLDGLLKLHRGKWVAYHGAERIGIGASETGLYARCFQHGLKRGEFVVRSIEPLCGEYETTVTSM